MAAALSVFWQAPLFIGIGVSEILCSVPAMEFFYANAPERMKAVRGAELLRSRSASGCSRASSRSSTRSPRARARAWIAADLNEGRLDLFFALLAARRREPRRLAARAPTSGSRRDEGDEASPSCP